MVSGFWYNQDGLPLQYGTQKPIPELGGDYLMYGDNREAEWYIALGATSFGNNVIQVPALPSSFVGTSTPIAAGIQSMTTMIPLQSVAAPVTVANSSGVLSFPNPEILWDELEIECLITANAGTGAATGITVGLATTSPGTPNSAFVQVTPNAGTQFVTLTNAAMTQGHKWKIMPDGTITGSSATGVTAGNWISTGLQLPLVTNVISGFQPGTTPLFGWVSALATAGTYTGASGGGLLKMRLKYTQLGSIAN
jgi:hypothetical protein